MKAQLIWQISSILQIIIAIAHLLGTLFTKLLYPKDSTLIGRMKTTILNVDPKANQWDAWIFFNIAFSLCLLITGIFSLYYL